MKTAIRALTFGVALAAAAQDQPAAAHFHHLHLNSTDPAKAIDFYTSRLPSEKQHYAGDPAVKVHGGWLLFTRISAPPKAEITSGIWHMGWGGGADMKSTYQKQLDLGTPFATPLTDLSDQCDGKGGNGRFLFAYIDAPDHALIELNTTAAGNDRFGHIHLLSADPIAAGEWYVKHFGLTRRGPAPTSREPRFRCGRQTGPAVSLMVDEVNLIIYPDGWTKTANPDLWKGRERLESTRGHAIDHLAFAVPNLDETLARLERAGVRILERFRRQAFIEAPDSVRLELVQDSR